MLLRRKVLLFLSLPLFAKERKNADLIQLDPMAVHYNAWKDMWNDRAQKPNASSIIDIKEMREWRQAKEEFHKLAKVIDESYKGWK